MNKLLALMLLTLALLSPLAAAEDKIPGQRQMPLFKDSFLLVSGSWTEYDYLDKTKNETGRIIFTVLDRIHVKNIPCFWMEIEVEMKGSPAVVTRILAEETKDGPGRIEKAIVQVKGMSPFIVPKKYLKKDTQQVGEFKFVHIVKRLEQRVIQHEGKKIQALRVEAEDAVGAKTTATISLELPPIALYEAESPEFRMTATDWGLDAKSRIKGKPVSFTIWIFTQLINGLVK
jgi:hypothetical protein